MDERDELVERIFDRLSGLVHALKGGQGGEWLDIDVTILQLKALFVLHASVDDRMSMKRLADRLGISVTAATGLVDRLVEQGLVQREEDSEDRRLVLVRLSRAGRAKLDRWQEIRRDRFTRIASRIDTADLIGIARAMDILYNAAIAEKEVK